MYPETWLSRRVDRLLERLDAWLGWIWLVLLGVIVLNVVLRYAFGEGRIEFEEIQWHLYAIGMMLGLSICYADDAHVRVDVLHECLDAELLRRIGFQPVERAVRSCDFAVQRHGDMAMPNRLGHRYSSPVQGKAR